MCLAVQTPVSCKNVFYHCIDSSSSIFVYFPADRFLIRLAMVAYPFDPHDAYFKPALEMETPLLHAFLDATASFHLE